MIKYQRKLTNIYYTHFSRFVKWGFVMDIKNRVLLIATRVICAVFLIIALFLGITAVFFSVSGGVPNIFGSNVYLVKTDAFELLPEGSALFASQVHPSDIEPGNIVIFNLENDAPALGEILTSKLSDGVYSFTAAIEGDKEIFLSQSQIVAKGKSFSGFWGGVINFAVSPLGMLFVAVLPCLAVVIVEVSKFFRKVMPQPEIETVKKQYEVPTYTPESSRRRPERRTRPEPEKSEVPTGKAAAMSAYKTATLDDSLGIYESQSRRSAFFDKDDDVLEVSREQDSPLFTAPTRQRPQSSTTRKPAPTRTETMPLSQKKLNEAIAASKAEREMAEMQRQRADAVNEIKRTRSEAIAAEKEAELAELAALAVKKRPAEKTAGTTEKQSRAPETKKPEPVQRTAKPSGERNFTPEFKPSSRQPKPTLKLSPEENVKQYTPKRSEHVTSSLPRLDALLNDDSDNSGGYSIDDILAGLEKRNK